MPAGAAEPVYAPSLASPQEAWLFPGVWLSQPDPDGWRAAGVRSLVWVTMTSLPASPVSDAVRAHILEQCGTQLLTSYGLRSLAPTQSVYRGEYGGSVVERDGAYHQGPVWTWLLGHWAIAHRVADPARVAIMGTSYGGYSALVGLTFTPEKFACAVDLVGISNLVTWLNTLPEYWITWKSLLKVRVGDYTTEAGLRFLEERSPLNRAGQIVRPLLIGQGANDVRVKAVEAEQIVAAMQQHGIPVIYVYYPDEGHGLGRAENRSSFAAVAEGFLSAHLGGHCEPVGNDFANSTIEFKVGGELIPGLDQVGSRHWSNAPQRGVFVGPVRC